MDRFIVDFNNVFVFIKFKYENTRNRFIIDLILISWILLVWVYRIIFNVPSSLSTIEIILRTIEIIVFFLFIIGLAKALIGKYRLMGNGSFSFSENGINMFSENQHYSFQEIQFILKNNKVYIFSFEDKSKLCLSEEKLSPEEWEKLDIFLGNNSVPVKPLKDAGFFEILGKIILIFAFMGL